jgi:hypothetical protein
MRVMSYSCLPDERTLLRLKPIVEEAHSYQDLKDIRITLVTDNPIRVPRDEDQALYHVVSAMWWEMAVFKRL